MRQIILPHNELDFSNYYPEHSPLIIKASILVDVDENGEATVTGCIAECDNDIFGVKVGDWFDPEDSISLADLKDQLAENGVYI